MIEFPTNPTVGTLVAAPNGTAWRWDGTTWLLGTGTSAAGAQGKVAYAEITTSQTNISAEVVVTGSAVTFNAVAGRTYRITGHLYLICATPITAAMLIVNAGSGLAVQSDVVRLTTANTVTKAHAEWITSSLSSGSQTFRLHARRELTTDTISTFADPSNPGFLLVEDITLDAGPGGAPFVAGAGLVANISSGVVDVGAGNGLTASADAIDVVAGNGTLVVSADGVIVNPDLSVSGITAVNANITNHTAINATDIVAAGITTLTAGNTTISGAGGLLVNNGNISCYYKTTSYAFEATGEGISYPGATAGGGNANRIGFRWGGGAITAVIDNVAAITLANASDRRLKYDIADYAAGLDLIMELRPRSYTIGDFHVEEDGPVTFSDPVDDTRQVGLIADEVQEIDPTLVLGEVNDPNQLQSVNYNQLITPLIQAIQDQQRQIEALTARIEALEGAT